MSEAESTDDRDNEHERSPYSPIYTRYVLGMVLLVMIFNNVDRTILSILVRPIKAGVRACEHGLLAASRAMRMADRPVDDLDPLLKTVLFNQFHDILPGSCAPAAAHIIAVCFFLDSLAFGLAPCLRSDSTALVAPVRAQFINTVSPFHSAAFVFAPASKRLRADSLKMYSLQSFPESREGQRLRQLLTVAQPRGSGFPDPSSFPAPTRR